MTKEFKTQSNRMNVPHGAYPSAFTHVSNEVNSIGHCGSEYCFANCSQCIRVKCWFWFWWSDCQTSIRRLCVGTIMSMFRRYTLCIHLSRRKTKLSRTWWRQPRSNGKGIFEVAKGVSRECLLQCLLSIFGCFFRIATYSSRMEHPPKEEW
jgi:hypothetical protein